MKRSISHTAHFTSVTQADKRATAFSKRFKNRDLSRLGMRQHAVPIKMVSATSAMTFIRFVLVKCVTKSSLQQHSSFNDFKLI